ncbi:MAG: PHP domain-containing protein [Candidatus Aminicenantes bacterium]|nr:PHP domain-containing protein [Candidatus Aminicenantes bacterium]
MMTAKLKVDFHIHTAEDPKDYIPYSSFQLIDVASQKGFDALAITNHDAVYYNPELVKYAENKGILLIPGMEATFSDAHVLILNPDFQINPEGRSIEELSTIKNEDNLIIAPHPFFLRFKSLDTDLLTYIHLFDAIEFSQYYNRLINFNKKAVDTAKEFKKPLIATSDCHFIWQFGDTYSLVEAKKDIPSIIAAVKSGKIEIFTKPISLATMAKIMTAFMLRKTLFKKAKKRSKERRFSLKI